MEIKARVRVISTGLWVLSGIAFFLAFALGLVGSFVVPAFAELFAAIYTEVPRQIVFLNQYRHGLWGAVVLVVVTFWFARQQLEGGRGSLVGWKLCFAGLSLILFLILALVLVTLYSPIFNFGC